MSHEAQKTGLRCQLADRLGLERDTKGTGRRIWFGWIEGMITDDEHSFVFTF